MAESIMKWKPDTCDCIIEELQNPSVPEYGVRFSKVLFKCPVHDIVLDEDLYGVLMSNPDSEQRRKNLLEGLLVSDNSLNLSEEFRQDNGTTARRFKDGIKYDWKFEGSGNLRTLKVKMTGITLTPTIRNIIDTFTGSNFGSNKVIVE